MEKDKCHASKGEIMLPKFSFYNLLIWRKRPIDLNLVLSFPKNFQFLIGTQNLEKLNVFQKKKKALGPICSLIILNIHIWYSSKIDVKLVVIFLYLHKVLNIMETF